MSANIKTFSALKARLRLDSEHRSHNHNRNRDLMIRILYVSFLITGASLCSCSRADNTSFEYTSIYSPTCTPAFQKINHVGNIDYDWGLWGHNLQKALGCNLPQEIFAFDGEKRNQKQYCFSSKLLYQRFVDFILNKYGDGTQDPSRFVIMPNDNSIVCQCPLCKAAGNTEQSATPAVSKLIVRLARRFPHHTFFTSSYASVKDPPSEKMPANVGVIISAMSLPFSAKFEEDPATKVFETFLNKWKKTVNKIYVWDYMRNFDDYLSPYPCLGILQKRLKWYLSKNISGIILNGSGDNYSAFDDMQTSVLTQLMKNPEQNFSSLVREYYSEHYPISGKEIADYYLSLENRSIEAKSGLLYYGGICDEVQDYLTPQEFLMFERQLNKISKQVTGDERHRLNMLLTGFNFTQLELIRAGFENYDAETVATCLIDLEGAKELKNMKVYREAYGNLKDYINYYHSYPPKKHHTDGVTCNVAQLTDGLEGSAYDYHTNWVLSNKTITSYTISTHTPQNLTIGFLQAPVWHIYAPVRIEIWQDGKLFTVVNKALETRPQGGKDFLRISYLMTLKGIRKDHPIELRIIAPQKEGRVTVACDEIE